jgi:toxin ParE1/3/4
MGRARPELRPDLRSFPVGRFVIFYREVRDGIEIVRVLRGARDLPALFNKVKGGET